MCGNGKRCRKGDQITALVICEIAQSGKSCEAETDLGLHEKLKNADPNLGKNPTRQYCRHCVLHSLVHYELLRVGFLKKIIIIIMS